MQWTSRKLLPKSSQAISGFKIRSFQGIAWKIKLKARIQIPRAIAGQNRSLGDLIRMVLAHTRSANRSCGIILPMFYWSPSGPLIVRQPGTLGYLLIRSQVIWIRRISWYRSLRINSAIQIIRKISTRHSIVVPTSSQSRLLRTGRISPHSCRPTLRPRRSWEGTAGTLHSRPWTSPTIKGAGINHNCKGRALSFSPSPSTQIWLR